MRKVGNFIFCLFEKTYEEDYREIENNFKSMDLILQFTDLV
ncbi:hypothetical protein BIFGAL_04479 [Bifidobacterium gallicum DSM 20093 = LMG 11596]|uniref:Uncharacterized protein n=1 Tax=Bifidobacterium gallicum DSM 20093 = LMG 11596 TaxID=561180 RepID=D1NX71_9BIFI|nr:hypothetical protein BIFGAL_04479 [Bifidobacterium gallicum DSM 20093 = LMG 11596]